MTSSIISSSKNEFLMQLCDITYKALGGKILVDHVSFVIRPKTVTTLIGPNGAGKTTLLKIMLGLLKETSGTLQRADSLKIGYMPQRLVLDASFPLTVKKFLSLALCSSVKKTERLETIHDLLYQLKIDDRMNRSVHALSGGEWQRVLLARALLSTPNLLILDEPVQCLDHNGQIEFYQLLTDTVKKLSCAVVQVSHDLHLVWDASDEIICMNTHICCHGTPEYVQKSQSFQSLFGGFKHYIHHHDHHHDGVD